jgi:hypothetical protein
MRIVDAYVGDHSSNMSTGTGKVLSQRRKVFCRVENF